MYKSFFLGKVCLMSVWIAHTYEMEVVLPHIREHSYFLEKTLVQVKIRLGWKRHAIRLTYWNIIKVLQLQKSLMPTTLLLQTTPMYPNWLVAEGIEPVLYNSEVASKNMMSYVERHNALDVQWPLTSWFSLLFLLAECCVSKYTRFISYM